MKKARKTAQTSNGRAAPPELRERRRLFAAELLAAREELGLKQRDLAELFEVTLNTYSRWERAVFLPQAPGAIRLALECLQYKQAVDGDSMLREIEHHLAITEAMRERLERERSARQTNRK
jgi:transcriptional regulator with XRE-family HTH domain